MLFNSLEFALFLPAVFGLYWLLPSGGRWRNALVVAASYFFYGWWDWRFVSLIAASTLVDYLVALRVEASQSHRRRRRLLAASVGVNLGLLGYFKYAGFFVESFAQAFTFLGAAPDIGALRVALPVGISFYTFQTMSYTIDVYRRSMPATRDLAAFAAYVAFFPQLVAGPIERARDLLPQFLTPRAFDRPGAVDGLRQMLWGFFKKMAVADTCARLADAVFADPASYPGYALALGAALFAVQIYGDFSGYSDIAIGAARLFGLRLSRNFSYPYFSRDIAEFWRRWHMSLTGWFRDYVYIPLGGSRGGRWQALRNTAVVFVASGLWHGANWTFVAWGALNALLFAPLLVSGRNRRHLGDAAPGRLLPRPSEALRMALTFALVTLGWVLFRSASIPDAWRFLRGVATQSWSGPSGLGPALAVALWLAGAMFAAEWLARGRRHALQDAGARWPRAARWALYAAVIAAIGIFAPMQQAPFIYFQF